MIQRIQTLYLFIPIICLIIVQFGVDVFYLIGDKMYALNAYGIINNTPGQETDMIKSLPLFMPIILIVVLLIVSIFYYKNLKNQLNLVKLIAVLYSLLALVLVIIFLINFNLVEGETEINYKIASGFYFIMMGLPGVILAIQGIKKDLNLLDSLNRLR